MMSEDTAKKIADLERACRCLYIEVPSPIARDVKRKADAVINQLKECRASGQIVAKQKDEAINQLKECRAGKHPAVMLPKIEAHEQRIEQSIKVGCLEKVWEWLTRFTGVQYTSLTYDSLKQAIDSVGKEGLQHEKKQG